MKADANRLRQQLCTLAAIGKTPEGICRLAYSEYFWKSNDYIASIMGEAGMTVHTNPVGNVVGTYAGNRQNKIVLGSHIDSVINGGMFDGCLGVIAGIEAVRVLHENGITPEYTIEVVAFAEEEGLVIAGLVGSRAYCGLPPTPIMLEKMEAYGMTVQDFANARAEGPLDYALELHIEQGGILESRRVDIGVVSAIIAIKRYLVTFTGVANHAGTTPMTFREDALVKAARFIQRVPEITMETDPDMVGTVGYIQVQPNAMNTVPGQVELTLELRALNECSIDAVFQTLTREFETDITSCELTMQQPSYHMDPQVRRTIHDACRELGLSTLDMGSGAGHDSMSLAQVTKTGMLFVPSVAGISHSNREETLWRDVEQGTNALLQTLCLLNKRLIRTDGRSDIG